MLLQLWVDVIVTFTVGAMQHNLDGVVVHTAHVLQHLLTMVELCHPKEHDVGGVVVERAMQDTSQRVFTDFCFDFQRVTAVEGGTEIGDGLQHGFEQSGVFFTTSPVKVCHFIQVEIRWCLLLPPHAKTDDVVLRTCPLWSKLQHELTSIRRCTAVDDMEKVLGASNRTVELICNCESAVHALLHVKGDALGEGKQFCVLLTGFLGILFGEAETAQRNQHIGYMVQVDFGDCGRDLALFVLAHFQ